MRRIDTIVIHCTATPQGRHHDVADVRRWHTDPRPVGRGWSDIGYHYLVHLDGTVEPGRPVARPGAHVRGHNRHSIGVCYVGGVDADMRPKDTRTEAQVAALSALVRKLRAEHPITRVVGHRDLDSGKACPCFDARSEYGWNASDDADPMTEAAAKPNAAAKVGGAGVLAAAAPVASAAMGAEWQAVAVIGGIVVAVLALALIMPQTRRLILRKLGAPV